jgi:hypothetical protein
LPAARRERTEVGLITHIHER